MAKLTLDNLANLRNDTTAVSTINANNDAIEAALENTLSRDGTSPNTMSAQLDMNSQRIVNLPAPVDNTDALRKIDLTNAVLDPLNVTVVDEDDMASDSAVKIPTQQSVKAYVDANVGDSGVILGSIKHVNQYADFETALADLGSNETLLVTAGSSHAISAGYVSSIPSNSVIKSDVEGVPFTLTWAAASTHDTTGRFRVIGSVGTPVNLTASINGEGQRMTCSSIVYSGGTVTVTLNRAPERALATGQFWSGQSYSSATSSNALLSNMTDSDEGMDLNVPVEITQTSTTTFTFDVTVDNWVTATAYAVNDLVEFTDNELYRCLEAHTSGTFATDLAASKWVLASTHSSPASVAWFENDQFLKVADTSGFSEGDMVSLSSSELYNGFNGSVDIYNGWLTEIQDIRDSNWMRLQKRTKFLFDTSPIVTPVTPVERFTLQDCIIVGKGVKPTMTGAGQTDKGLHTWYTRDCNFVRVSVVDCFYMSYWHTQALRDKYIDCVSNCQSPNNGGRAYGYIDFEYGFTCGNGCNEVQYIRCKAYYGRHGFDESCLSGWGSGLAVDCKYIDCETYMTWSNGFATHDMYLDFEWIRPRSYGGGGLNVRNGNCKIIDPYSEGSNFTVYAYGNVSGLQVYNSKGKQVGSSDIQVYPNAYGRIVSAGSGYSVNDILTIAGGTKTVAAQFRVTSVNSSGGVTGISNETIGDYTIYPQGTKTTTVSPVNGTGCTLRIAPYKWELFGSERRLVAERIIIDGSDSDGGQHGVAIYNRENTYIRADIRNVEARDKLYYALQVGSVNSGTPFGLIGAIENIKNINSDSKYVCYLNTPIDCTISNIGGDRNGDITGVYIYSSGTNSAGGNKLSLVKVRSRDGNVERKAELPSGDDSNVVLDYFGIEHDVTVPSGYYRKPNVIITDRTAAYQTQADGYIHVHGWFVVDRPIIVTSIMGITETADAGATVRGRYGIVRMNSDLTPGEVVIDTGETQHPRTTGIWTESVASVRLDPGIYGEMVLVNNSGTVRTALLYGQSLSNAIVRDTSNLFSNNYYSYVTAGSASTADPLPDDAAITRGASSSIVSDMHKLFLTYTYSD